LRLEERKIMGSEYINPHHPKQHLKLGSEYFITLNIRT